MFEDFGDFGDEGLLGGCEEDYMEARALAQDVRREESPWDEPELEDDDEDDEDDEDYQNLYWMDLEDDCPLDGDAESALASAGFGTDEDYGFYDRDDDW